MLALHLSGDPEKRNYWLDQIQIAAQGAAHFLQAQRSQIQQLAKTFTNAPKVFVLGTGPNLGTAEEASLKVIEMAKMYSECQELEDFMHGRLREVDPKSPLFFIAPHGNASQKVLNFLTVTDMVKAPSVVLTDKVTNGIQRLATHVVEMPVSLNEYATPLLYILPMHLFGYEMALARGYDPNARRYNIVPQNVKYQEQAE
jgi:glucosamine--fructose-6-phosphate aminotransferase (isomerizing)